jgi:uncharacterized Ntn-hydrolase superfamily protein
VACLGNGLPSAAPVEAMRDRFNATSGLPLAERLLRALEHARDGLAATHERVSSSLLVRSPAAASQVDLRVDLTRDGGCAVADLRRVFDAYAPLTALYEKRSNAPHPP